MSSLLLYDYDDDYDDYIYDYKNIYICKPQKQIYNINTNNKVQCVDILVLKSSFINDLIHNRVCMEPCILKMVI